MNRIWVGAGSGMNLKSAIRRLKFAISMVALLLALSLPAEAQQPGKIYRIGLLRAAAPPESYVAAFRQGLKESGYIEGKNVGIEYRYAGGRNDQLPHLAAELVELKVDVIVASTTPEVRAAQKATSTIPILFVGAGDPVRSGLVASLARPGGNITGLSILAPELYGKRLELLKETFPKISRVAVFYNSEGTANALRAMQAAAPALGLQLQSLEVRSANDFDSAFEAALKGRAQAITASQVSVISTHRQWIVDFAAKNRMPAIYPDRLFVDAGGLMSYGLNDADSWRRAAVYVDKILKGAKPADLPVEQPTKFELIINLKAAKQMGLTIPPSVLYQADKVIK